MKRLLVYVHYNKYNDISEYVYHQLKTIRSIYSDVVLVSNSRVSVEAVQKLKEEQLVNLFVQRENIGFDFAAWKEGLAQVEYSKYHSVTLMNDTCFGPLWGLEIYYSKFETDSNIDFWGMTNHLETKVDGKVIPEHLQSYFMVFKRQILQNERFIDFWASVRDFTSVQEVINLYETQLTALLLSEGFRYRSLLDMSICDDVFETANITLAYPDVILQYRVPFLKIKAFTEYPDRIYSLLNILNMDTEYPIELVKKHLRQITIPGVNTLPPISISPKVDYVNHGVLVLLHIHIESLELFEEYVTSIKELVNRCQIVITIPDYIFSVGRDIVQKSLECCNIEVQIVQTDNDAQAFITAMKCADNYDYIAHLTIRKTKIRKYLVQDRMDRCQLRNMFFESFEAVLFHFERQSNLVFVLPDLTTNQRYSKESLHATNPAFISRINLFYNSLATIKKVDFSRVPYLVGTGADCYWIRGDYYKQVKEELEKIKFSKEDSRILPILFTYVAWNFSYDYAVVENLEKMSPLLDKISYSSEKELRLIIDEREFLQLGLRRTMRIIKIGIVSLFKMIKASVCKH